MYQQQQSCAISDQFNQLTSSLLCCIFVLSHPVISAAISEGTPLVSTAVLTPVSAYPVIKCRSHRLTYSRMMCLDIWGGDIDGFLACY